MFDVDNDKYVQEAEEIDYVFNQFNYDFNLIQSSNLDGEDNTCLVGSYEYPKEVIFKYVYQLQNIFLNKPKRLPYLIVTDSEVEESEALKTKIKKYGCYKTKDDDGNNVNITLNNQEMVYLLSRISTSVYQKGICKYSRFIDVFFEEFNKNDINYLFEYYTYSKSGKNIFLTYEKVKILNEFVDNLYKIASDSELRDDLKKSVYINERNYKNYKEYINSLFKKHSRLLVLRVDFGISQDEIFADCLNLNSSNFYEEQVNKIRAYMAKFLNNIRKNSQFQHMKGYIWKLEYGFLKGCHYHCIFFFDGSKVQNDVYLASLIGKYWQLITNNDGYYFNCNKDKNNKYKNVGVGMINYYDKELLDNLTNKVLKYLVKKDQYISYDGKVRSMGHAGKNNKKSKLGRPRTKGKYASNYAIAANKRLKLKTLNKLIINLGTSSESVDNGMPQNISWIPNEEVNGFFLILGSSGSGKTETLKSVSQQIYDQGIPIVVLDFHGDIILDNIESTIISDGIKSFCGINPLQIISSDAENFGLTEQRRHLLSMFMRAIDTLSPKQSVFLEDAIAEAYKRQNILDNDYRTWSNTPPTMKSVLSILNEWLDLDTMSKHKSTISSCIFSIRALFGHPIFSREEYLDVHKVVKFGHRLDLSKIHSSYQFIVAETLLTAIFKILRCQGVIPVTTSNDNERYRLFIVIDEIKILTTGRGNPNNHHDILNVLVTEARKYGIGIILASQIASHLSHEVHANIATKLVLKPMSDEEAKKNKFDLQVSANDLLNLNGKGDGFFKNNKNKQAIRIQIQPYDAS
ncbi:YagK/YfjJ domain-containing protein [Agitococcus lubricus]|uniref:Uncharacterized protein DUF87 n=1 Tax=Agitococcus lubricus TaxID=1077255 RepID=A0A2T5IWZ6_9GAMM|nr:inovirus-type Gp2 protein [Agitococcus lubricus]PTQ88462.1 uncharacterized protein DUF87 [Agitococcus lubricus]